MNKKTGTVLILMVALGLIVCCGADNGSNNSFWGDYAGSTNGTFRIGCFQ